MSPVVQEATVGVSSAARAELERNVRARKGVGRASALKTRARSAAARGKGADAQDGLTWHERLLTPTSALFVVFLASLAFPNQASKDPQAAYALAVGAGVWAIGTLGCLLARKRSTRDTLADVCAIVLGVLAAWQLATAAFNVLPEKMFPAPGIVFAQIVADSAKIGQGIASSLGIVAEGYLLGTAVALVLGLALGFGARTSKATEKVVSFLSAIPPIVYIPYGIALLPTFRASSVMVIFLATLWPVLTGTLAGVSNVDKRILDSARVLNVGRVKTLTRVVLPGALPLIFNGLNIALCLSFILLTSAEMIGGSVGMGYYVKYYSDFGDYTRILAGIIVIGVVITAISVALNKLQKHLTRWK